MLDWQLSFLYYMLFHPNNQEKYEMEKGFVASLLRQSYQVLWSLT